MPGAGASIPPRVSRVRAFFESRDMTRDPVAVFAKHSHDLGDTFVYYFGGVKKAIVTQCPLVLKHVLKDNYKNYHKSDIQVKRMGQFLGPGLLTSHGDYWLKQRQLIQKGLRRDKLVSLASTMHDALDDGLARFDQAVQRGPVDLCEQVRALTFRMVTRSLLSTGLKDEEADLIDRAITAIQDFMVRQIVRPYLAPWFALSGETRKHDTMRRQGEAILRDHISRRRRDPNGHDDILQTLLDARYDDGSVGMTDEQVLNESMQLLIAAHETSSTALSWAIYLLCRHPEHLARATAEFETVLGDAPMTFADVHALEFNNQVLDEALRLYPPFWMVDRKALTDDRAGDVAIPKGTTVIAFIFGAHHAPEHWERPSLFDPARFTGANKDKQPDYAYLPFGAGPRGCLGGNYAQLQMLMILSEILRNYQFTLANGSEVATRPRIILRPQAGIPMTFRRSKNND